MSAKIIVMVATMLSGVLVWIVALLLLAEATRQLLDTLQYIVELAQMS